MRDPDKGSATIKEIAAKERLPIDIVKLDVNDDSSVKEAIERIAFSNVRNGSHNYKDIDVLVNNAGHALLGCMEDLSIDEIKTEFETNLFGMIRVTQAVLPFMRKRRRGTIVNMSAITGRVSFPGIAAYSSTKFAIEAFSESMAYELEQFGINVVLIEPGAIKTNIMKSSSIAKRGLDPSSPYLRLTSKVVSSFRSMQEHATSPEEVAKIILNATTAKNPKGRYVVGSSKEKLGIFLRPYVPDKILLSQAAKRIGS